MAVNGAGHQSGRESKAKKGLDPMSHVLSMGPRLPVAVVIVLAVVLHGGVAAGATAATLFAEIAAWNRDLRASVKAQLDSMYEVEMVKQEEKEPPPPPPEPEPEPVKIKEIPKDTEPPPPMPAAAAAVLTADTPKDAPPDMVDFTSGTAQQFAGGQTSTVGDPNSGPVRNVAAANTGTPGGTGTAPVTNPGPKVDRSRAASLAGSGSWNDCPFPSEADAEQIDDAYVSIAVSIGADGAAQSVTIAQDPGHGFAREARKCAMRKKYNAALDVDGKPVAATWKGRVHFQR